MKKAWPALAALALAAGVRAQETGLQAVTRGNTRFALALYKDLAASEKGDLFFSPYSISAAFAMTLPGAKGETAAQMARTLSLPAGDPRVDRAFAAISDGLNAEGRGGVFKLSVANALWGQAGYPFRQDYLARLSRGYGAGLQDVDFKTDAEGARERVNEWVSAKTQGKIEGLFPRGSMTDQTRLVLANAVYFKGDWLAPFKKRNTEEQADFRLEGGGRTKVALMSQTKGFGYAEDESLQALELPYRGDRLSMVVLLPRRNDGLSALERSLSEEALSAWTRRLTQQKVDVYLPRFTARSSFALNGALARLGMPLAFERGKADFSGMTEDPDGLAIDAAVHQAYVKVDEQGTEAAAATGIAMIAGAAMEPPHPVFRADHPFLYLIRDRKTGTILFLGRVKEPKA